MFVMRQGGGGQHSRVCGEVSRRRSRQQLRLCGVPQQRLSRPPPLLACCAGHTLPSTGAHRRARLRLAPRRVGQLCAAQTSLGHGACGSGLPRGRFAGHRLNEGGLQQLRHHGLAGFPYRATLTTVK